jgi:signal transduction histidine kinase
MHLRFHTPRRRPDWWPENEPWPPRGRLRKSPFFRRIGCLFGAFNGAGLAVLVILAVVAGNSLGWGQAPAHFLRWVVPGAVGVAVFLVAVFVLGGLGLRRALLPLDDLLDASGKVAEGDYSTRVPEKGPPELRSLARAFNDMTARLHQVEERRRNLLADVTHELRTPLTVIQGNLEGMLDGVYPADEVHLRAILDETRALTLLTEDLRTLALAESGALQLRLEPVDLVRLIGEILPAFEAQALQANVSVAFQPDPQVILTRIDPGRVRQVLVNLLANALRHTPPGGQVLVRCRVDGGLAVVEVRDSGSGIHPEDLPHVFERFYKSADSGGMGLGLAIARHLVTAHGGTIGVESAVGRGTLIRFTLPLSPENG